MKLRLLFSFALCVLAFNAFSQITSVGIIGTATPTGWDSDTDLTMVNDSIWNISMTLSAGECKFRANDAWDTNWGAKDFPIGDGVQGGVNIVVNYAGDYTITFNSNSGRYVFEVASDIGIIGDATFKGWDNDFNLFQDKNDPNRYYTTMELTGGKSCKFRQDDAWTVNWGGADFPSGIATQDGPNIPIPNTGKYNIEFNKSTGAYTFDEIITYFRVQLIGSAVPAGGIDTLFKDPGNPNIWKGALTLTNGDVRFQANNDTAFIWGGEAFPYDTATLGGPAIPVTAGDYLVIFNTQTGIYDFKAIVNYATIGIIGSATPGGWDADTDMTQDPNDISIWKLRIVLSDGEAKFRADNDWAINWGGGDFPTGIATQDGPNIPVPAGEYQITFNSTTGEYNFKELVVYGTVGLIGPSTPIGTWDTDVDMTKDANDENFWSIDEILLTDGECKFRAEDAWAVNWGADAWPAGIGIQDGPNIPVTAGVYRVTLNSATGEFAFGNPQSALDLLRSDAVKLSPNPASDMVNIEFNAPELRGEVRVTLFNSLGAQVYAQTLNVQDQARLQVGNLVPGTYMVHITNGQYVVAKQVVVQP